MHRDANKSYLGSVVETLDSVIQWISIRETNNCTIQWIEIYPVDSAIQRLNNPGLVYNVLHKTKFLSNSPEQNSLAIKQYQTSFLRVFSQNKIETNQIILEKKSNVKTEATQQAREIWQVLDSEYATIEAN